MKKAIGLMFILVFIGACSAAKAVEPDEILSDPVMEARARDISAHLRCLVCQNETIDDSNASLARDLRLLVRERLVKGDSNEQAMSYIVARYGEYVLLKPRFEGATILLWLSPILILFAIFTYVFFNLKGKRHSSQVELTAEEKQHLQKILDE
ncbi:cytochrome c-type biogenesis protein CcmH [Bartonella sp. HY329]|uniref:cytochrome c-type biogenesis protein n=1 Tax=unclassified Bartonella TaxID=2645622 RepID=UPI0021C78659|nr:MULTISPECIES: cytochrome c-type biogenesis protein [unclassified Bartonella]UXM96289.1 cytochrome c-type biogenesis protein CcmH [Bartonella sp. HY329]UXN10613.1 cytochrome c-type biogenesis protein CcmH [Bartonella sp. HY328]